MQEGIITEQCVPEFADAGTSTSPISKKQALFDQLEDSKAATKIHLRRGPGPEDLYRDESFIAYYCFWSVGPTPQHHAPVFCWPSRDGPLSSCVFSETAPGVFTRLIILSSQWYP
ncbi:hypothetical protein NW754_005928 [Fusarium falciforme]|uniref:Uncharacterized protein n=1 Tax=Fusarium falciforme TaxID=195108 RepID=A0A9W8RHN8_9HYPO|nr:hypothetical protein NW754_005928 [Fusarium falciforme]KAJ4191788.1 hypothetical protein NW767_010935 [Fusarium falciforme]KAJ4198370.1 hypothetical protein NW755_001057 [Fusarium falciforme]KAJ4261784.1 hypothetical protein NW757_000056 [Fusarium falciforme]